MYRVSLYSIQIHFVAILCDHLPSLKYGRIRLSYGYRWNSIATHSCNWGYQLKKDHGDVKRVCQDDGSWSGSPPLCIRKFTLISGADWVVGGGWMAHHPPPLSIIFCAQYYRSQQLMPPATHHKPQDFSVISHPPH